MTTVTLSLEEFDALRNKAKMLDKMIEAILVWPSVELDLHNMSMKSFKRIVLDAKKISELTGHELESGEIESIEINKQVYLRGKN